MFWLDAFPVRAIVVVVVNLAHRFGIGVKEIERLIQKLELDKEILADPDAGRPLLISN